MPGSGGAYGTITASVVSPATNSLATTEGDVALELRSGEHVEELVQQFGTGNQLKALVDPGGEDLTRRTIRRDRG